MTNSLSHIDDVMSLPEALFRMAEQYADHPAQWFRSNQGYQSISYAQFAKRIQFVASGLIRAGVQPGDRIALLMENRPEWAALDYAILSIGAITVPLYCSYRASDIAHVLNDSGSIIVLTSGGKLLRHLLSCMQDCPDIQQVYAIDDHDSDHVISLADLESGSLEDIELAQRLMSLRRDTLATVVYTSGTTAHPKGVMLTHGNIITNLETVPVSITLKAGRDSDRFLSFLPLAHMLERTGGHFLPYSFGLSVAFAERPDTVAKNMVEVEPSLMVVVPRMLEVIQARILAQVNKQSNMKKKLFHIYLNRAKKKKSGLFTNRLLRLLDRIVGHKIRQRFGGRLRVFLCGGAPLSADVAEFFEALGLPIMVGYGLTESAPLLSINPLSDRRAHSVGIAAKGVELRIADDGEILARGPNIMQGYWHNEEATRLSIIDGWLQTGDIGSLCADGYLTITDRKKDIIVNSGGENIAPQRVESILLGDQSIDQVALFGDKKPYLVALIIPNKTECMDWAQEQGLPESDWQHLCDSSILKKHMQNKVNSLLKLLSPFEQVRRIHVIAEPFSVESDTLTPTMKIKRRIIYMQYAEIIENLYH